MSFGNQWTFDGHRSGWNFVLDSLKQLHNPKGVLFDGFIEQNFGWYRRESVAKAIIPYTTPWAGVFHNPPNMPQFFDYTASPQTVLSSVFMRESLPFCKGAFVFSGCLGEWLSERVDCPVSVLKHPTEVPKLAFSWQRYKSCKDKKVVQVGFWLRKMRAIKHLDADGFKKIWIVPHEYARKIYEREARAIDVLDGKGRECNGDYEEWENLGAQEYDKLLAESVVFMELYDSSVNNTIIECIVRNTPVLVNPLPAVIEYLGDDYPFYFDDLTEAARKLQNESLIKRAHEYLVGLDKTPYRIEYFRQSFVESDAYRSLPVLRGCGAGRAKSGPRVDSRDSIDIVHGRPLSTDFMFVVCFRNQQHKILRCLKSIARQCDGKHSAGVALVDDASSDNGLRTAIEYLKTQRIPCVAVENPDRKLFTRNLYNANTHLATRPDTIIVEVDGDDYLEDADVLDILSRRYSNGARKTFGSFRMAPGSNHFPGFEVVDDPFVVTDVANAWDLDFCYPWMHLKTYRRELFMDVPLEYFWERNGRAWLKTAEDLSSHPMMMCLAGPRVHFIRDVLYVYDFSGSDHELNERDRPDYIVSNFYRVPSGTFVGEYWEQVRRQRFEESRLVASMRTDLQEATDDSQEILTA